MLGVIGNGLASRADFASGLQLGREEVLRDLVKFYYYGINRVGERKAEKKEVADAPPCVQSHQHWYYRKSSFGRFMN